MVACLRITSPYTKFHDEFLNMKSPFEFGEVGVAELNKEAERTISNLSGEEERSQRARVAQLRSSPVRNSFNMMMHLQGGFFTVPP